jgi:antitoxin MazE
MQVLLSRWGNSLGLRIPKAMTEKIGLRDGSRVEVQMEDDRIVISSAQPRYRLSDLLIGMTPDDMRDVFDWGEDVGREAVEE